MTISKIETIKCTKLSKRFGYFLALKNITFNVEKNTIFGILGPNGAGKTTLVKIFSGLLTPSSGEFSINEETYKDNPKSLRNDIGIIIEKSFLYDNLTIFENIKFYYSFYLNYDKNKIKTEIERYLKLFNLSEWIDEPIRNLSKGMKKKVELIRVLIHNPSILILDEPFSGLDLGTIDLFIKILKDLKLNEKKTIILTTHNIDVALKLCDELIVLKEGKINKIEVKDDFHKLNLKTLF